MEEQLLRAVEIASSAGSQRGADQNLAQQALTFIEQAKANAHEVWQPGWAIFAARTDASPSRPLYSHQQRLFGLGLVTEFLENKIALVVDSQQAIAFLQAEALKHFDAEYIAGTGEDGVSYIKNKYAQFMTTLLVQTYALPPPFTLLSDLVARMCVHDASSTTSINPTATDMTLRLLHETSITLGSDVTLRSNRSNERIARDTAIRDEIRAAQAASIAEAVWKVIEESFAKVQELRSSPSSMNGQGWTLDKAVDLTCVASNVIGDYASWIDINYVITQHTVGLLYRMLQYDLSKIRSASADALVEVVGKGMKAVDKFALLQALNLTATVAELERSSRMPPGHDDGKSEETSFREHLGKLANAVASELAKIVEDTSASNEIRQQADDLLLAQMDLVLDFLTDAYDELAEAVLPCIALTLTIYKKLKRQNGNATPNGNHRNSTHLSTEKSSFLAKLMKILLIKMKFDEGTEWNGCHEEDDDEDDAEEVAKFLQLRKQLQQHAASIAGIDESLFSAPTTALISETLDKCDAYLRGSGPEVSWQQAEVALFVLFFCGEVLAGGQGQAKSAVGPTSFVILPANTPKATRNKPPEGFLLSLTLNPLGEMTKRFYQSDVSAFRHPAVQMQYFDCSVRFAAFFSVQPQMLADALAPFLDWRGIHNERVAVRSRTNYLFLRFLKETRSHIRQEFIRGILEGIQDLLVVNATLPVVGAGEDPLEEALRRSTVFDGQLDLFEACGVLLQLVRTTTDEQTLMLKALLDPLLAQLRVAVQRKVADASDLEAVLNVHHLFFALANLAKGFPDISPTSGAQSAPWMTLFKGVIEEMLASLETADLSEYKIIRDAARGAFSRMVNTTGFTVLPYVPALLRVLLPRLSENEVIDFYGFLGLITSKYKTSVADVMDELLGPLLERTFHFLNQDVAGTDDVLQRQSLIRGYVNFLSTLIGAGLDGVLRSERNQGHLETVIQSLVFYGSNSMPATARSIFNILARTVSLWLQRLSQVSSNGSAANANVGPNGKADNGQTLPGFEQYVYKTIVPLIFEVPSKADFDFDDAQSQIALTELCNLLKAVLEKRGEEFVNFLLTVYLPSLNCPPEHGQTFVVAMQKQDVKAFKKSLEEFIKAVLRRQPSATSS